MPKRAFTLFCCAVLFVTASFATGKKSDRARSNSEDRSNLSLQSGDLSDAGRGGVGNLTPSQGGDVGGPLMPPCSYSSPVWSVWAMACAASCSDNCCRCCIERIDPLLSPRAVLSVTARRARLSLDCR
jgi:hypothetical protein